MSGGRGRRLAILGVLCVPLMAHAQLPTANQLAKLDPDVQAAWALMQPPIAPAHVGQRKAKEALASRVAEAVLRDVCDRVRINWDGGIRAVCEPQTEIWSTVEVDPLLIEAFLPDPGRVPSFSSGAESLYRTTTSRTDLAKLTMAPRAKNPGPNETPYPVFAAHMEAGVVVFPLNPQTQPHGIVTLCVGNQPCTPGSWQLTRAGVHWNGKTYVISSMEKGEALSVLRTWHRPDRVYLKYTAPRGLAAPLLQNAFPHFRPVKAADRPRRFRRVTQKDRRKRRQKKAAAKARRTRRKIQMLREKTKTRPRP